jgi:Rod binding domain-containing protein
MSEISNPGALWSASWSSHLAPSPGHPAPGKAQKAARDFEAQLIGTVFQTMEKTFATLPGQNPIAGDDDYNYLGTEALAQALADRGGFGLARLISSHLDGTKDLVRSSPKPGAGAGADPLKFP